jgi:response regulator RpfG family c-di-GMP phosphodiesterase
MHNNPYDITDGIKNLSQSPNHPVMFFNEEKVIIYSNKSFQEKFEFPDEESTIGLKPDFLITTEESNVFQFTDLPINEIISEEHIFYFKNKGDEEYVFKILIYKVEKLNEANIYRALFIEITDLNDYLMLRSIRSLLKASQLKDNDTGEHIQRINEYSYSIALYLSKKYSDEFPEITKEFINRIHKVASMHDVGKIGIPDFLLTKPAKLTDEEFKIMQEHTINGAFILSEIAGQMARDIALFHHEKWNGSGYPYSLKEDQIPLSARIVAVADVYDALRMKRSYKTSFPHNKSKEIILEGKGKHFDPRLVEIFLEIDSEFSDIYDQLADEE